MPQTYKFQLFSDLHLEYCKDFPKIKPITDDLFLAGDIGNLSSILFEQFITYCSNNWKRVFIILGNHEYYKTKKNMLKSMYEVNVDYINFFSKYNNVHLLDNSEYKLSNGLIIAGSTLWSNPLATEDNLDFRQALYDKLRISVEEFSKLHNDSVVFLKNAINKHKKILIMTHFPPTQVNTSNPLWNNQEQYMKDYYAAEILSKFNNNNNNYSCFGINTKIKAWLFGHTHHSTNMVIDNINLISNQLGYNNESIISNFNSNGVIEIII